MTNTSIRNSKFEIPHSSRVVIVGGGLAGIAAAVRLAERGTPVTLVETRKRLGGRATSFVDPATGQTLDNCQHVVMRCCTNLLNLYEKLGVADRIAWHRALYFADGQGRIDRLEGDDLPAPLHLARSMLAMRTLTLREKLAIARGMHAIMRVSRAQRAALADSTFAHWLRGQGQSEAVIEKFWSLIVTSACNEHPRRVACHHALQVFQEGFLCDSSAYEMGVAAVPLVELYDAAERTLARSGGEVLLGCGAERFIYEDERVRYLRLTDRQEIAGDIFISTVPFDRLAKLVTPAMIERDARLRHLDAFDVSPILGIHLLLRATTGRPIMDLPHLALMDSPLHWLFHKGQVDAATAARLAGQTPSAVERADHGPPIEHLHGVISAAYDLVDLPAERIVAMVLREVRRVLPGAGAAALVHARVVKEKRATFAARPGVDALRPTVRGDIENLLLAGDWVDTGWPATMEGAVRSGYRAAAVALALRGTPVAQDIVPDLGAGALYRFMSA